MQTHVTTHQAEEDARNEDILIYLNGQIVPKAQAVVSVYDSGFMLGDGIWEGLRLYDGTWAFLDDHFDRLFEASKAIDLDIGMTRDALISALLETQKARRCRNRAPPSRSLWNTRARICRARSGWPQCRICAGCR